MLLQKNALRNQSNVIGTSVDAIIAYPPSKKRLQGLILVNIIFNFSFISFIFAMMPFFFAATLATNNRVRTFIKLLSASK